VPTVAPGALLKWSDRKIAQVEKSLETIPEANFLHWTQKAELYAARGDTASARLFIDHAMATWSGVHSNNQHFLTEIVVAALIAGQYDLVYDVIERHLRPDWRFEIQIVEDMFSNPYIIEWEVVSRTHSVFRFDAGAYRSDAAHIIFLNWIWSYRLFDTYHKFGLAISGKTLFSLGDMAVAPGLAFSANRSDAFLVPDAFFLSKSGYREAMVMLDRNQVSWSERRSVVFWRGSTTGLRRGDWRTLQRIKLCLATRDHPNAELFDVGITVVVQVGGPESVSEVETLGIMRDFVPSHLFGRFKYLIDIDGNSNSWEGLFLKLCTGSPVLKVASAHGFRQWYYDDLKPWVNYVPVAADLADLGENAAWLRTHDGQAELIGKRGRALAQALTCEAELVRGAQTVSAAMRFFHDSRRIAPMPGRTNETGVVRKPRIEPPVSDLLSSMAVIGSAVSAWREKCRIEMDLLKEDDSISPEKRLERYVSFSGPSWQPGRVRLMDKIAETLSPSSGAFRRGDVFGDDGCVKLEVVQTVLPGFTAHYPRAVPADAFERFDLVPAFDNPFVQLALPPAINKNMATAKAPALAVYRAGPSDLFLTPLGYQLFRAGDGIYWPAASTRAYPQEAMQFPHVKVDKPVVIVQDVFEGTNYAHFLLDWVPRLGHFLNSGLADQSGCMFVMGGAPSEFHFHVIKALCAIYSMTEDQFLFPKEPQVWHIAAPIYFFSDLKETIMHPAHMASEGSIAIIRDVCSRIQTATGELKRIYISRGDAALRKVTNEAELLRHLRSFGFVDVQLASIPFLEQVALIRGADVIVAPHGMGLTHIAFHEKRPLIVELHNPTLGTDAYAFIAHALGFRYRAVMGEDLGGDTRHFNIRPQDVIDVLMHEGVSPARMADIDAHLRIRTKFSGGVQSGHVVETSDIRPPRPDSAVYRHVRDDVSRQPDNNCGWLEVTGLIKGVVYHCACDVWLPSQFNGRKMEFVWSGLASMGIPPVDLAKRDQWQTISVIGVATNGLVNFVLRCDAESGETFYSSRWRTGLGGDVD
jgi:hypothetical protein